MECDRCLEARATILPCGHHIHPACHEAVRDEGARCPASLHCDGSAFMLEGESEDEALARLENDLRQRRRYPAPSTDGATRLARMWAEPALRRFFDQARPGHTPYYFDGALYTFSCRPVYKEQHISIYRDYTKVACVLVNRNEIKVTGQFLVVGCLQIGLDGLVSSSAAWKRTNFTNAVEMWEDIPGAPMNFWSGSSLLARARDELAAEIKAAVDRELKPLELAIECLQLRASFRDAGLDHLLQPLQCVPLDRKLALTGTPRDTYKLAGGLVIYLFGDRTYLRPQDGVVRDLHLPHPDAWAQHGRWLSVFIGEASHVFDGLDGSLVDRPANPLHYVGESCVLDASGRVSLSNGQWYV